jgi:hypothetical protein
MTTAYEIVPATREGLYSKTAITGPAGAGKTMLMLYLLHALAPEAGKRLVIDCERGRSRKYVGVNGWQFDILRPVEFSPASLVEILGIAASRGYQAVGIDGWSQYWSGTGGMLEQVDKSAAANRGDKFGGGWKSERPKERRMLDAILAAEFHIVSTMRVKTDYVQDEIQRNGQTVKTYKKVGMKPEQREGIDYEFDLVLAVDTDHTMTVEKTDMVTIPDGATWDRAGEEFSQLVVEFCDEGIRPKGPAEYRAEALEPGKAADDLVTLHAEVTRRGLAAAPVTAANGQPTTLAELIKALGVTARAAERRQLMGAPAAIGAAAPAPAEDAALAGVSAQAADIVRQLLHVSSKAAAQQVLFGFRGGEVGRDDVLPLLHEGDREVLGIPPDTTGLSLVNLGARVVAYVGRRETEGAPQSVRAAQLGPDDAGAGPDDTASALLGAENGDPAEASYA